MGSFNTHKRFPKLYGKTKKDEWKVWEIWVETFQGEVLIKWQSGLENGKKLLHSKEIHSGKNIGRSNETTPVQQAVKEAQAKWQKKVDKGMIEDKSKIGNIFSYFPMLAKTAYSETSPDVVNGKKKITTLPRIVLLQPKLNGVRCIVVKLRNVVKLYSRGGKEYTKICNVLVKHLSHIMDNKDIWDGEIYVHGWELERIVQATKRDKSKVWRKKVKYWVKKRNWDKVRWWLKTRNDTQILEFHRYDKPFNIKMDTRKIWMDALPTSDIIKQTQTRVVPGTWYEVKKWHDLWVKQGYEGVIIRDPEAKYLWDNRDKRLLKYKEFIDEEFEIIGYKDGVGTDRGAVTWICRNNTPGSNNSFDCRPRGTIESRRGMFKNGKAYIGKMLTVRFQQRTMDDLPQFPVGITIRDYE
jgi:DNA ligase-1